MKQQNQPQAGAELREPSFWSAIKDHLGGVMGAFATIIAALIAAYVVLFPPTDVVSEYRAYMEKLINEKGLLDAQPGILRFLQNRELIKEDTPVVSLAGADLRGATLTPADDGTVADLSGANLNGANLSGAHLSGAYLSGAYLTPNKNDTRTDLSNAYLNGATLYNADLRDAKLSGADLRWAKLRGANLSGALLEEANLIGASINEELERQAKSLAGAIMPDGRSTSRSGPTLCPPPS